MRTSFKPFCPCGIYNSPEDSKETSLSFSGSPLSVPIFSSTLNPSTLRKVMDKCFEHYDYIANKHNATTIKFISNPMNILFQNNDNRYYDNTFLMQKYHYDYEIQNTSVNLLYDENHLLSLMSKYHRRNITRAPKKGLVFNYFDNSKSTNETDFAFTEFQKLHFLSAGRNSFRRILASNERSNRFK